MKGRLTLIPKFDSRGLLPSGIHRTNWEELVERFGYNERRRRFLRGLKEALEQLKASGCQRVYIGGSFVTDKQLPNDIDACWDISGVDPSALDPVFFDFANGQAAQKARFNAEFFPAQITEGLTGKLFIEFFQRDKQTGETKGIIELMLNDE